MSQTEQTSQLQDFRALLGTWKVQNRRKKGNYLSPDQAMGEKAEWEEFWSNDRFEKQLDGRAVVEHWEGVLPSGQKLLGYSIKAFEPTTDEWSIVWIDNLNPLDFRPLVGKFVEGVGTFFQIIEASDGSSLHVRFIWDNLTETTARWQQAFSFDEGKQWETNWVMTFTRES